MVSGNKKIKKFFRYITIYGFRWSLIKSAGRANIISVKLLFPSLFVHKKRHISLIGAGQFGFASISFHLLKKQGNVFLECYDIDERNAKRTASFYGYHFQKDFVKLIKNPACEIVYIASNHASHTSYAIEALKNKKTVYVEKPVSVNYNQFSALLQAIEETNQKIFVGYNRPFSAAVSEVNKHIKNCKKPITLNCFIVGHKIPMDHWYRNPEEGTRICGNVGHWIDLSFALFNTRGFIPQSLNTTIAYSDENEPDDNVSISITTDFGDLVTITLTSREEPFEGINETINLQCGETIAKIDDFRKMILWNADKIKRFKYFPKDVGHRAAINQPFNKKFSRDFLEVKLSTIVMLDIMEMVINRETQKVLLPFATLKNLEERIHETNYTRP